MKKLLMQFSEEELAREKARLTRVKADPARAIANLMRTLRYRARNRDMPKDWFPDGMLEGETIAAYIERFDGHARHKPGAHDLTLYNRAPTGGFGKPG